MCLYQIVTIKNMLSTTKYPPEEADFLLLWTPALNNAALQNSTVSPQNLAQTASSSWHDLLQTPTKTQIKEAIFVGFEIFLF